MNLIEINNFFNQKINTIKEMLSSPNKEHKKEIWLWLFSQFANIIIAYTYNLINKVQRLIKEDPKINPKQLIHHYLQIMEKLQVCLATTMEQPISILSNNNLKKDIKAKRNETWNKLEKTIKVIKSNLKQYQNQNIEKTPIIQTNKLTDLQKEIFNHYQNLFVIFEKFYEFSLQLDEIMIKIISSSASLEVKNDLLISIHLQFKNYFKNINNLPPSEYIVSKFINTIFWKRYAKTLSSFNFNNQFQRAYTNKDTINKIYLFKTYRGHLIDHVDDFMKTINCKHLKFFEDWTNIFINYVNFNAEAYYNPNFLIPIQAFINSNDEKPMLYYWFATNNFLIGINQICELLKNKLNHEITVSVYTDDLMQIFQNNQLITKNPQSFDIFLKNEKLNALLKTQLPTTYQTLNDLKDILCYHPHLRPYEQLNFASVYKYLEIKILKEVLANSNIDTNLTNELQQVLAIDEVQARIQNNKRNINSKKQENFNKKIKLENTIDQPQPGPSNSRSD
ncbi:hypothetical protein [Spiroplasma eriocheiris]|uniref:Uncharacterized protein n=1 Tax=Spiroplasma eriocheiris TaxID=315358 RepID=A0A0H3XMH8_9MOLU|nr:hypothetical protein [Spiroplasma eriocheiris]AHF57690.1 hypothetical protein SPE_0562 [Spiroplasma eriocheiris CCTCC M 207170]AKM54142.1 hypothetical protein SERIO_v1c05710 [Spiroplasma eriocheiris]